MQNTSLVQLYQNHVQATRAGAIVKDVDFFLCHLTREVIDGCGLQSKSIHINTKVIKHLYDKRPAEEFDFILRYLKIMVTYPDEVYRNTDAKRADLGFVKQLKGHEYFCAIEKSSLQEEANYVVTCFRIKRPNYMKNYKLLWSWKGGIPSS